MLEECVSNHCHQRVTMKAVPRPSLEVVETEFLLQLLMSLFADPSCLDRRSQAAQVHLGGQVGKIIFLLPGGAMLADEPGFVALQMLLSLIPYSLRSPSAVRTRTAANRAFNRPFVPLRQLTVFHLALASMSSVAIDRISDTCRLRGRPRTLVTGQMSCTPTDTP